MRVEREFALSPRDPAGWEEAVSSAVQTLAAGELLVHPTSSSYGLGGAATPDLDAEINRLKRRPHSQKLIRLAGSAETLRRELPEAEWGEWAERLAAEFWPGPLTLVLPNATDRGTAVRVDSHPVLLVVLGRWRGLMSSTSLNATGDPPAFDPESAHEALKSMPEPKVRLSFLSAGTLSPSRGSTILSLLGDKPDVIREGPIDRRRIARCLEIEV